MKWLYSIFLAAIFTTTANASPGLVKHAQFVEADYNLPAGLLVSICKAESNWRNVLGQHGEHGVCQIKPATVRMICPDCGTRDNYLQYGVRSKAVESAQVILQFRGLYKGKIDGIFGPRTYGAVKKFQVNNGLSPDGIVGPKTWRALFGTDMNHEGLIGELDTPKKNIEYAAMFLDWLRDYLGTNDPDILAAAYNGGPANPIVRYMIRVRGNRV